MSFKDHYYNTVRPKLVSELGLKNTLATPRPHKVIINVGVGEAVSDKKVLERVTADLAAIGGQRPVVTRARKSISAFKIRRGLPIGAKVTLRGKRMYDFLERLTRVVLPRVRDFSGVSSKSLDRHGNLNLGLSEQTLFPEVDYDIIDKVRGLEITIVTNAGTAERGRKLLEQLGIPFAK